MSPGAFRVSSKVCMISPGTARNGPGPGRSEEEIDVSDGTRPAPNPEAPVTEVATPPLPRVTTLGPTEVKEGYPLPVAWPEPAPPAAPDSLIVAPPTTPPASVAPTTVVETGGNS